MAEYFLKIRLTSEFTNESELIGQPNTEIPSEDTGTTPKDSARNAIISSAQKAWLLAPFTTIVILQ
jgi:hypothetical protein